MNATCTCSPPPVKGRTHIHIFTRTHKFTHTHMPPPDKGHTHTNTYTHMRAPANVNRHTHTLLCSWICSKLVQAYSRSECPTQARQCNVERSAKPCGPEKSAIHAHTPIINARANLSICVPLLAAAVHQRCAHHLHTCARPQHPPPLPTA